MTGVGVTLTVGVGVGLAIGVAVGDSVEPQPPISKARITRKETRQLFIVLTSGRKNKLNEALCQCSNEFIPPL
ncbi:MAG: hypothetical protein FJ004_00110 [Chloroflexi bacterium]|nr:hypothetical protein [Chloroflexota bacterium]